MKFVIKYVQISVQKTAGNCRLQLQKPVATHYLQSLNAYRTYLIYSVFITQGGYSLTWTWYGDHPRFGDLQSNWILFYTSTRSD